MSVFTETCAVSVSGAAYPDERETKAAVITDRPSDICGISCEKPKSPSLARRFSSNRMLRLTGQT